MDENTPFSDLKKRFKPKDKVKAQRPAQAAVPAEPAEPDADLFARAMAGTASLDDPRGRVAAAPAGPAGLDRPFAALLEDDERKKKMKKKAKAAPVPTRPKPAPEPAPRPAAPQAPVMDKDEYLFHFAMQGVERLDGQSGRDLPAAPPQAAPSQPKPDRERMRDLLRGDVEFELSFSEEFTQAQVKGLDPRTVQQLRTGHFSWEAHLDLHGLNAEQAQFALLDFVRDQYNLGRRCVLLVTGRGLNSPGGAPVLREAVRTWLTQDPLRRVVLAFVTALPRDGGAGALYVLLRKFKKSLGKVVWDRLPPGQGLE
ncbi:MAG: Smr/MutS family protein [Thermodesulfobacteriota bacterium]